MKIKGLRWVVLSLIVLVTIINYLDRGTLNYMWVANTKVEYRVTDQAVAGENTAVVQADGGWLLTDAQGAAQQVVAGNVKQQMRGTAGYVEYIHKGGIAQDLGFITPEMTPDEAATRSKQILAYITMFFMMAYGVSQLFSGKLYDKIGTRKGFVISALLWGIADACTSLARGLASLSFFRVMLGLGEAGPWPGTTKSNAEWFPVKERALAQGIFGAAASAGSILAPVIIPLLYIACGWQATFIVVGSLGLLWVIPWLVINKKSPKEHPWITEQEQKYIFEGQPETKIVNDKGRSWGELLRKKQSYAVILGRFFLDPIWWMFVTWLPIYLTEVFHLDIREIAMSAWVPYVGAAIGSIAGGWFSGMLIGRGKSVNFARKTAIILGGIIALPAMIGAAFAPSAFAAVLLMAFILGGFQFAMTNIQTLASDFFTGKTVGSLAGLGGASAVLGTLFTMYLVPLITAGGNWFLFFVMGALLVPLCLGAVLGFAGKIKLVEDK